MQRVCFPCIYQPSGASHYSIYFPDFPEACVEVGLSTHTGNITSITATAQEYLENHLYELAKSKYPIPSPTPFSKVPTPLRGGKALIHFYISKEQSAFLVVSKYIPRAAWRTAICIFSRGSEQTWEVVKLPDRRWYGWVGDPVVGEIYRCFTDAVQELLYLYALDYGWPLELATVGEQVIHNGGCPVCGSNETIVEVSIPYRWILKCSFEQCQQTRRIHRAEQHFSQPDGNRMQKLYELWKKGALPYPKRHVHYYNEVMLQSMEY